MSTITTSDSNLTLLTAAGLDVLWVAAAAFTTDKPNPVPDFCKIEPSPEVASTVHGACRNVHASMILSYISFFIRACPSLFDIAYVTDSPTVLVHLVLFLAQALRNNKDSASVWTRKVKDIA